MTPSQILKKARAKVARGWCQGAMYGDNGAVCALGAVWQAEGPDLRDDLAREAISAAAQALDPYFTHLADWNDAPHRTKAEVLAAFDLAIELAK
jgi:hypothetical protein